jgi:hypothetical protein
MPTEVRLEEAPKREDIMFHVVIGVTLAAAVLAMSSVAAVSGPMNSSLVCKAAASLNPVTLHLFAARLSRSLLRLELPLIARLKRLWEEQVCCTPPPDPLSDERLGRHEHGFD